MKTFILVAACVGSLVACGGGAQQTAEPKLTASETPSARAVDWPVLGQGETRYVRIDLGPDSFRECRRISPKFPFDSASTYVEHRAQLAAFASCMNAPSMRDRTIVLVGRADPRGSSEYNDDLGMQRANAIKQLLIDNGVAATRIEVTTEGAQGSVGDRPEYSYGYDRRVDIVVKGGTHAP